MSIAELPIAVDPEAVAAFCRDRGICKLSLFGSVLRGDFDPARSDVDVLVEYLYGVLMDHVSTRMLGGKTAGTASVEELCHALNRRHRMEANIKAMPGLGDSIVKYRKEAHHANQ